MQCMKVFGFSFKQINNQKIKTTFKKNTYKFEHWLIFGDIKNLSIHLLIYDNKIVIVVLKISHSNKNVTRN